MVIMEWECQTCTLRNPEQVHICNVCETPRDPRIPCIARDGCTEVTRNDQTPAPAAVSSKAGTVSSKAGAGRSSGAGEDGRNTSSEAPQAAAPASPSSNQRPSVSSSGTSASASAKARSTGKSCNPDVGISPEERKRVVEEITNKRRKQNEEKELILKQIKDERRDGEAMRAIQNARPEMMGIMQGQQQQQFPRANPAPPAMASSNQNSLVRIQLRNRYNQVLLCTCFGPENTIRDVLNFANSEMSSSGRIMRQELDPRADPQFIERTQQILRLAQQQGAGAGAGAGGTTAAAPNQEPEREAYVAVRLTYPPRTRYEGADLDQSLRNAGLTPSCTLFAEEARREGEEPAQAQGTGAFRREYGSHGGPRGYDEEDRDEDHDEEYGDHDDSDDSGNDDDGEGEYVAELGGLPRMRPNMPMTRRNQPPPAPVPAVPLSAEEKDKMREAAAKRFAEAPKTAWGINTASSSSTAPQPHIPVTVAGSKTKAAREEEKKLILMRAEEERREIEERRKKLPVTIPSEQRMDIDTDKQKKLQVRHPRGTEDVTLEDNTTFEMVLRDLREKLHLEDGDWSFRTNYPLKRWASENEQAQEVASEVTLPCVVILEKANRLLAREPAVDSHPPVSETRDEDDNMHIENAETAQDGSGEHQQARPQTEEEFANAARERQREARLAALRAAETRAQQAASVSPNSEATHDAEAVNAVVEASSKTPKPKSRVKDGKQREIGQAGLSSEERKKRDDTMARERKERDSVKQRILEEMAADRAFREARKKVEIPITISPAQPYGNPSPHTGQRGVGSVGNNGPHSNAGPSNPVPLGGSSSGTPAQESAQASEADADACSPDLGSTIRVRHPDGSVHFPVATATSTLRQILSMSPDRYVAVIPFPRARLQESDWDTPLAHFPNIFPSGTVVLLEIGQIGQQQRGGPIDPFSPDAMADAMPPALGRRSSEVQKRLRTFRSRTFEGPEQAEEEEQEKCGICLCVFQATERMAILKCNHEFHWDCMERCIRYAGQCPTCRQNII